MLKQKILFIAPTAMQATELLRTSPSAKKIQKNRNGSFTYPGADKKNCPAIFCKNKPRIL